MLRTYTYVYTYLSLVHQNNGLVPTAVKMIKNLFSAHFSMGIHEGVISAMHDLLTDGLFDLKQL